MVNHWMFLGYRMAGKSTLAAKMNPEYLVLDLDDRWKDQQDVQLGKAHLIVKPDVLDIVKEMEALRPTLQPKIGTVIVDSGTAILDFHGAFGRLRVERKELRPQDVNREKADLMRAVSGSVMRYHCDSVWIFHQEDARDKNGQEVVRTTISKLELERLKKNLHAVFEVFDDPKKGRGVRIQWCRFNNGDAEGSIIWDTKGMWEGMPALMSEFTRDYQKEMGYNGNVYGLDWLRTFLASKGKEYPSIDDMKTDLGIDALPKWFDRASWSKYVEKAGVT